MGAPKGTKPWNAGTGKGWVDDRGYRWVYITLNGKRVARREHRVLMEAHLGRMLEPWEIVHHKDEDTSNNSIENLEVLEFGAHSALHHSGARKSRDTKKTMEVFGLLREELKRERALKADLLEALDQQCELMAFVLNHVTLPDGWYEKFTAELETSRATLSKALQP